jgi:uncharacterized C2H2 Zn-finger protein
MMKKRKRIADEDADAALILLNMLHDSHSLQVEFEQKQKLRKVRGKSKFANFECTLCSRFFSRQCDLTRHLAFCGNNQITPVGQPKIDVMEDEEEDSPSTELCLEVECEVRVQCPICMAMFFRKGGLRRHVRDVHKLPPEEVLVEEADRQALVECRGCGRKYGRMNDLTRHMRYHCDQSLALEQHAEEVPIEQVEDLQTSEVGFSCYRCNQVFHHPAFLATHLLSCQARLSPS